MVRRQLGIWLGLVLTACGATHRTLPGAGGEGGAGQGAAGGSANGEADAGQSGSDAKPEPPGPKPVLSGEALEAEIERIAGLSFIVRADESSLNEPWGCPSPYGPDEEDSVGRRVNATLHFEAVAADELEMVVSLPTPWLRVVRAQLIPTVDGWVVAEPPPLGGCLVDGFEEAEELHWSTPSKLELHFEGADDAGRRSGLELMVSYEDIDESLVVAGELDQSGPSLTELVYQPIGGNEYVAVEAVLPWRLPRHFYFSEALRPGWSVAVENTEQQRFEVAQGAAGSLYPSEFDLNAYFPPGFHFQVEGKDLAGNPVMIVGALPSRGPVNVSSGGLEGAVEVGILHRMLEDYETTDCLNDSFCSMDTTRPLAGERSLAFHEVAAFLRITRVSGATTLRLLARVDLSSGQGPELGIQVHTLEPGTVPEQTSETFAAWQLDEATADDFPRLSLPQTLTVPLPPGTGDVLVAIDAGYAFYDTVWVDSVRTEVE